MRLFPLTILATLALSSCTNWKQWTAAALMAGGAAHILLDREEKEDKRKGQNVTRDWPEGIGRLSNEFPVALITPTSAIYTYHVWRRNGRSAEVTFADKTYKGKVTLIGDDLALITFDQEVEAQPLTISSDHKNGDPIYLFTRQRGVIQTEIRKVYADSVQLWYTGKDYDSSAIALTPDNQVVTTLKTKAGFGTTLTGLEDEK